MLPFPARVAIQHVNRPRLQSKRDNLSISCVRFQAHTSGTEQRNTNHDAELRRIAMPADRRSRRIFNDHPFDQPLSRYCREFRSP